MKGAEEGPSTETSQSTCPLEGAIIGSALARFSFLISSSEYPFFGHRRILGTLQVILKTFLGNAGFIVAILPVVHGKLEEFLVIIAIFPTVFVHLFPVCIQSIRVVQLRVRIHELKAFGLSQFHYLGR